VDVTIEVVDVTIEVVDVTIEVVSVTNVTKKKNKSEDFVFVFRCRFSFQVTLLFFFNVCAPPFFVVFFLGVFF
jgi:hypothetical protein